MAQTNMTAGELFRQHSANVFGAGLAPSDIPAQTTSIRGMTRSIPIYYPDDRMTNETRLSLMTALTLCGRSSSDNIKSWQTWVLSWTALAFPEMITDMKADSSREYIAKSYSETFVRSVLDIEQKTSADNSFTSAIEFPQDFPPTSATYNVLVYNCGTINGVYSYYALIVFLMGKRIKDDTRTNITQRRPDNLMQKFDCAEVEYILKGDGRMSDQAHNYVTTAWTQSTAQRRIIIPKLCSIKHATGQATEIVSTMFNLLEYSGMQPAALIHGLISACPWVGEEVPLLRTAYDLYVASVHAYAKEEIQTRPYIKLIYGDSTRIFHSKTLADLTSCAVIWLGQSQKDIGDYTAPGSEKAKREFLRVARSKGLLQDESTTTQNNTRVEPAI